MSDERAVLIGMNNPYGVDARYALYPLPRRATGARIYEMLREELPGVKMTEYRDAFDRRNVLTGPWTMERARPTAEALMDALHGRTLLLLGKDVRRAFGISQHEPPVGSLSDGVIFYNWIPHPSGLNQWYNAPENRRAAARVLRRLYEGERGLLSGQPAQAALL